jgi:hypothetical protein
VKIAYLLADAIEEARAVIRRGPSIGVLRIRVLACRGVITFPLVHIVMIPARTYRHDLFTPQPYSSPTGTYR